MTRNFDNLNFGKAAPPSLEELSKNQPPTLRGLLREHKKAVTVLHDSIEEGGIPLNKNTLAVALGVAGIIGTAIYAGSVPTDVVHAAGLPFIGGHAASVGSGAGLQGMVPNFGLDKPVSTTVIPGIDNPVGKYFADAYGPNVSDVDSLVIEGTVIRPNDGIFHSDSAAMLDIRALGVVKDKDGSISIMGLTERDFFSGVELARSGNKLAILPLILQDTSVGVNINGKFRELYKLPPENSGKQANGGDQLASFLKGDPKPIPEGTPESKSTGTPAPDGTPVVKATNSPAGTIDGTSTAQPTAKATNEAVVTQDISKLPADIQSIGPDAKYFQIQPDKSVIDTRDGSTAYDKDGKLVEFKYGNWSGGVAGLEATQMDGTRCMLEKSSCVKPFISPAYKGLNVYRVDSVSTGAFIRRPMADPNNGDVFGKSADFVIMNTLSKKGEPMLFEMPVQILEPRHGPANMASTGFLIGNLQTGKTGLSNYNEMLTGDLANLFKVGTELDLCVIPKLFGTENFPSSMPTNPPPIYYIETIRFYLNVQYRNDLLSFLNGSVDYSKTNNDKRPTIFFWGNW